MMIDNASSTCPPSGSFIPTSRRHAILLATSHRGAVAAIRMRDAGQRA
jgi:hypothetical protein